MANEWIHSLFLYGEHWKEPAAQTEAKPAASEAVEPLRKRSRAAVATAQKLQQVEVASDREQVSGEGEEDDDEDDDEDGSKMEYSATMRCRFAAALNDMERAGLLRCRRTTRGELVTVQREMNTWLIGRDGGARPASAAAEEE